MKYTIKFKSKRPRISAENGLPMYQQPVERRIAQVKKELGWGAWESIQFEVSRLNTTAL